MCSSNCLAFDFSASADGVGKYLLQRLSERHHVSCMIVDKRSDMEASGSCTDHSLESWMHLILKQSHIGRDIQTMAKRSPSFLGRGLRIFERYSNYLL